MRPNNFGPPARPTARDYFWADGPRSPAHSWVLDLRPTAHGPRPSFKKNSIKRLFFTDNFSIFKTNLQFWKTFFSKIPKFTMGRGPGFGMALWTDGPQPTAQGFKIQAAGPRPKELGRRLGPAVQRPAAHATLIKAFLGISRRVGAFSENGGSMSLIQWEVLLMNRMRKNFSFNNSRPNI